MTQWLLIGGVFVWLLALAWVLQDAYANFPVTARVWWAVITLLLGPFAIPLYLSERLTRRAEFNKIGHGKAAFTAPEGRRPFVMDVNAALPTLPVGGAVTLWRQREATPTSMQKFQTQEH
jgi:hypothetical protein